MPVRKPQASRSITAGKLSAMPAATRCALQHATSASSTSSGLACARGTRSSSDCTWAIPSCLRSKLNRCRRLEGVLRIHARPRQSLLAKHGPIRESSLATQTSALQSHAACRDPAPDASQKLAPACSHATCHAAARQRHCRRVAPNELASLPIRSPMCVLTQANRDINAHDSRCMQRDSQLGHAGVIRRRQHALLLPKRQPAAASAIDSCTTHRFLPAQILTCSQ
ncbi:hypothetical protein C8F00_3608 [Xanthomonas vasicola]